MNDKDGKIPDAIKKTVPKHTLEMPGPLGAAVRRQAFNAQIKKDYEKSNEARAKNFADKSKDSMSISKEHVREGARGMLSARFNSRSKGKDM